ETPCSNARLWPCFPINDAFVYTIHGYMSSKQHDAYAAWRLPSFRRYFAGNMILILGWQMQKVAIGWEIYERTHSAMALGYAGLAQFLPQALFMLFAGHITDTFNRKRVLMAALGFNTLAAVGLAVNSARGGSIYV